MTKEAVYATFSKALVLYSKLGILGMEKGLIWLPLTPIQTLQT